MRPARGPRAARTREGGPRGQGPRQDLIIKFGDLYLEDRFPKLDKIKSTSVE